jgi:hypothetical protein
LVKRLFKKLFPNWSSFLKLDYNELTDITDKTLNEVIDEFDNLNTIFNYENGIFSDKGGIQVSKIYFTPSIDNIFVESTITETLNGINFDGTKSLNKYLDINDNHPIDRVVDKITLKYDTTQFKTGAGTSYNLELNNIMGKVEVKDNTPIQKLKNLVYLDYDIVDFKTSASVQGIN